MTKDDEKQIPVTNSEKDDAPEDAPEPAVVETESEPAARQPELSEEEKLRRRVDQLEDQLLRAAADFDNFRKRMIRQADDARRNAEEAVLGDLLDVVDNFDRALAHAAASDDADAFRKGTELIYVQLSTLLAKYNVTPIDALGEKFDPNFHDALMQVGSDEYPEGVVALEIGKGYRMGDRVLRHSKVGVSRGRTDGDVDAK